MSSNQSLTDKIRTKAQIKPSGIKAGKLFIFWLSVFLIPALAVSILFRAYTNAAIEEAFFNDSRALQNELEIFDHELRLENLITDIIRESENDFKSVLDETSFKAEPDKICQVLANKIYMRHKLMPAALLISSQLSKKAGIHKSQDNPFSIGRKTASLLFESLGEKKEKLSDHQKKRFTQVSESVFGELIELPENPGTLKVGFSTRKGPDKIFTYLDFIRTQNFSGKILLLFSENSLSYPFFVKKVLANSSEGITRSIKLLKTSPDRQIIRSHNHELIMTAPTSSSILRIGSHQGKSWYDSAFLDGTAYRKPGRLPFLVVKKKSGRNSISLFKYSANLNLSLLIIVFFGIFLSKSAFSGVIPGKGIQTRFRIAIMASTLLPFGAFFLGVHQFAWHFANVNYRSQLQSLQNELTLLEMSLKNNEARYLALIRDRIKKLESLKNKEIDQIKAGLDEMQGRYFEGYTFLRSDGGFAERLPDPSIASVYDYNKLLLARDLLLAQSYSVFEWCQKLFPENEKNFETIPGYKAWRAFRVHFTNIDRNNFCINDGKFYAARQADSSHFMISTHNLFSESEKASWATIMLVVNRKRIIEEFLNNRKNLGQMLLKRNSDNLVHMAIFFCHDNTLREIDKRVAWPANALTDKELLEAAQRINSGKLQAGWGQTDSNGITRLFAARSFAELPIKLVAKSESFSAAEQQSSATIVVLLIIVYSLFLIYLVSSTLSQLFINPLEKLMEGVSALNNEEIIKIDYQAENEFGLVISEFNSMTEGIRQRKLLDRFVSREVSEAIKTETRELKSEISNLEFRTIMFIHIRHFNQIIEKIPPESAISLLNMYFSAIEPVIKDNNGQIDKYIGDAIMASFSGIQGEAPPEIRAIATAVGCIKILVRLNHSLKEAQLPEIKIGTGIACGNVITGRIGSRKSRQDFTCIGDTVNLAARLEALSHYSEECSILVSETIQKAAEKAFSLSFHGELTVKGKARPVKIYRVES